MAAGTSWWSAGDFSTPLYALLMLVCAQVCVRTCTCARPAAAFRLARCKSRAGSLDLHLMHYLGPSPCDALIFSLSCLHVMPASLLALSPPFPDPSCPHALALSCSRPLVPSSSRPLVLSSSRPLVLSSSRPLVLSSSRSPAHSWRLPIPPPPSSHLCLICPLPSRRLHSTPTRAAHVAPAVSAVAPTVGFPRPQPFLLPCGGGGGGGEPLSG